MATKEAVARRYRGRSQAADHAVLLLRRTQRREGQKVFTRANPLDFAWDWSGKHKRKLTADLDQALVLVGACFDGSGINASDTLKNANFKPHVALKPLLDWLIRQGPDQPTRDAATRAAVIYNAWAATQAVKPRQGELFASEDYA